MTRSIFHKSLAAAIMKANKEHLLKESVTGSFADGLKNAIDNLSEPETSH